MSSMGNSGVDDVDANYTSGVSDDNDADFGDYTGTGNVAPETESVPSLASSGPTKFPLLHLLPELRLLIYEPLISAGDINILRTSKLVHQEAVKLMKIKAVLRMKFGFTDRTSSPSFPLTGSLNLTGSPTIYATSIMQHVEIHVYLGASFGRSRYFDAYTSLTKSFGGRDIARQSCTISVDLGRDPSAPNETILVHESAWQAVTDLTGFKLLVLKLRRERDYELEELRLRYLGETEHIHYPHMSLLEDYETVRDVLKVYLGPAHLDKSVGHHCLEFHPYGFEVEEHADTDNGM